MKNRYMGQSGDTAADPVFDELKNVGRFVGEILVDYIQTDIPATCKLLPFARLINVFPPESQRHRRRSCFRASG